MTFYRCLDKDCKFYDSQIIATRLQTIRHYKTTKTYDVIKRIAQLNGISTYGNSKMVLINRIADLSVLRGVEC